MHLDNLFYKSIFLVLFLGNILWKLTVYHMKVNISWLNKVNFKISKVSSDKLLQIKHGKAFLRVLVYL